MILGLPELTVYSVGIALIIIFGLLILWGIVYPKGED